MVVTQAETFKHLKKTSAIQAMGVDSSIHVCYDKLESLKYFFAGKSRSKINTKLLLDPHRLISWFWTNFFSMFPELKKAQTS